MKERIYQAISLLHSNHHIIEVAEDIVMVVKRFCSSGLSKEEVAVRMDVPVDYVKECMKS